MFSTLTYPTYLLFAALSLFGPFVFYKLFSRETVVERTLADLTMFGQCGPDRYSTNYEIISAFLADGRTFAIEIENRRLQQFQSKLVVQALLTISRPAFGKAHVTAVTWPGEQTPELVEKNNGGLYLGVVYFMLGLFATVFALQAQVYAGLGHAGTAFAGLLVAMSGFVLATLHMKPLPADARADMLGGMIKLGKGRNSIFVAATIACVLTLLCYTMGGLGLLIGINLACATGMLCGMWLRQSNLPSSPECNQAPSLT